QDNCLLTATVDLTAPECGKEGLGHVHINATSGTLPYDYYLNGNLQAGPDADIAPGFYDYWVHDAAGCWWKSDFTLDCEVNCHFRTQTQGGWGATPNGNNPAMYLQNHFASCFPNGVTIGCQSANTLTLTT